MFNGMFNGNRLDINSLISFPERFPKTNLITPFPTPTPSFMQSFTHPKTRHPKHSPHATQILQSHTPDLLQSPEAIHKTITYASIPLKIVLRTGSLLGE
ncbi:MAG: hypothetical protein Q9194_002524 [Teloschistes cf. exilis]